MKYWKEGFYEEPQDGAVEITDEYYNELLNGQSLGFEIRTDENGYPYLKSNEPETLEEFKTIKIAEVQSYDKSGVINEFFLNGIALWFGKTTRAGLKLRFEAEQSSGQTITTLWNDNNQISIELSSAIQMIYSLEIYASKCYDTTQEHISAINSLSSIELVNGYDYMADYPEKLNL